MASPLYACTWQRARRSSSETPLAKVTVCMRDLVNRFLREFGSLSEAIRGVLFISSLSLSSVIENSAPPRESEICPSRAFPSISACLTWGWSGL